MTEDYRIEQLNLFHEEEKQMLISFLSQHHLKYEENIDVAFGVFSSDDRLLGCGCAAKSLLKCFAVEEDLRGQNALGALISALMQNRFTAGLYDLFVITRQQNEALFVSCGLFPVVRTNSLILLENKPNGPEQFSAACRSLKDAEKEAGAIVMNCNPFTLGHRWLIEQASARCDILHIFVVEADHSFFSTHERLQMVREGTAYLPNVRVHLSGHYMISDATFPTYFLKENEDATQLQCEMDITLFAERIAPPLHITKRFAGEEPFDETTEKYNQAMASILPSHGIQFCQLPRYKSNGQIVSASRVRALLKNAAGYDAALHLVPATSQPYLKAKMQEK